MKTRNLLRGLHLIAAVCLGTLIYSLRSLPARISATVSHSHSRATARVHGLVLAILRAVAPCSLPSRSKTSTAHSALSRQCRTGFIREPRRQQIGMRKHRLPLGKMLDRPVRSVGHEVVLAREQRVPVCLAPGGGLRRPRHQRGTVRETFVVGGVVAPLIAASIRLR